MTARHGGPMASTRADLAELLRIPTWSSRLRQPTPCPGWTAGANDLWIDINNETVISMPGIKVFGPEPFTIELSSGQYPLVVRFSHRIGESGMRFRSLSTDTLTIWLHRV